MISASTILAALPQTQCQRCGFPDCAAYAQAIAAKEAPINQCPPGGQAGIEKLASLTNLPVHPLNETHGTEGPRHIAYIDENWCIGCTLCIEACPVDAIIGSHKLMHTVIESACTGCELCIPACPVDCIEWENVTGELTGWQAWNPQQAEQAAVRYASRLGRLSLKPKSMEENDRSTLTSRVEQAMAKAQAQITAKPS